MLGWRITQTFSTYLDDVDHSLTCWRRSEPAVLPVLPQTDHQSAGTNVHLQPGCIPETTGVQCAAETVAMTAAGLHTALAAATRHIKPNITD